MTEGFLAPDHKVVLSLNLVTWLRFINGDSAKQQFLRNRLQSWIGLVEEQQVKTCE